MDPLRETPAAQNRDSRGRREFLTNTALGAAALRASRTLCGNRARRGRVPRRYAQLGFIKMTDMAAARHSA